MISPQDIGGMRGGKKCELTNSGCSLLPRRDRTSHRKCDRTPQFQTIEKGESVALLPSADRTSHRKCDRTIPDNKKAIALSSLSLQARALREELERRSHVHKSTHKLPRVRLLKFRRP
jgi:hypothetical protein